MGLGTITHTGKKQGKRSRSYKRYWCYFASKELRGSLDYIERDVRKTNTAAQTCRYKWEVIFLRTSKPILCELPWASVSQALGRKFKTFVETAPQMKPLNKLNVFFTPTPLRLTSQVLLSLSLFLNVHVFMNFLHMLFSLSYYVWFCTAVQTGTWPWR